MMYFMDKNILIIIIGRDNRFLNPFPQKTASNYFNCFKSLQSVTNFFQFLSNSPLLRETATKRKQPEFRYREAGFAM